MNTTPDALFLVVGWINDNTKYHAKVTANQVIAIEGAMQKAWLYLEEYKRWGVPPGLYLMADIGGEPDYREWSPRPMPALGDPNYFKTLVELLDDGPKPF